MTFRRTIVWFVLFLLVSAGGVGGYVYWRIANVHTEIRERLLAELAEKAPNWSVSVDRVRFDWNRTIHVYGFTLRPRGDDADLATIPEIRLTFDREKYDRTEVVDVLRVHLLEPSLLLDREPDGTWNWQRLLPMAATERSSLPEWIVDDAEVRVRLRRDEGVGVELPTAIVDGRVVPSGKRRFEILGGIEVDGTGTFDLDGKVDVDRGEWSFAGRARDLVSGERLVDLATRASPETRTRIAQLDEQLQDLLPEDARPDPVRVADASDGAPGTFSPVGDVRRVAAPTLGISGRVALEFSIEQPGRDEEVAFSVEADLDGAQVDHPVLPFPLHDVSGRIAWGNRGLVVENLRARNGVTRLAVDGRLDRDHGRSDGSFHVSLDDVALDDRLRSRLTGRIRQVYDTLRPRGRANLTTDVVVDDRGPRTENLLLRTRGATLAYEGFPYPIEQATGGLKQTGRTFAIVCDGRAGDVPVHVRGRVVAGVNEVQLTITANDFPIDERFRRACPAEARDALERMRLTGRSDVTITVQRPPGLDTKWRWTVAADVERAAVECSAFPYRCNGLTAKLAFDSAEGTWWVRDVAGRHDDARITGIARFDNPRPGTPARLRTRLVARNAAFDRQLRLALPADLRRAWTVVDPGGTFDAVVSVDWSPGRPPDVRIPAIEVTGGTMRPEPLPIKLTDVTLAGSYAEGRFDVTKFEARRRDTRIRGKGFYLLEPDDRWRLRIDDLFVDDLVPDTAFREALPDTIGGVVETMNPRGLVSLSGRIEFRGRLDDDATVTSAWELDAVLPGTTVAAGVDLEKVHGGVSSKGTYDGHRVVAEGALDLDSVVVLGYQVTQVEGPYRVEGDRITLGSRKAFLDRAVPITLAERITGRAIDGTLVLDGIVVTGDEPAYNVKGLLSQGRLESYAKRYMPNATQLAGVMNGWIDLHGRGTDADDLLGAGQLQISPAALYELPVVLKLLTAVPFARNRSAFDHALLNFKIARQRFLFDSIDLTGDALVLRGRGTVGFKKDLNLDFYSQSSKRQLGIPVVSAIVGEAAKGLVAVYVRGTLDNPQTEVVTAPTIDNALKSFLGPLLQPGPPPGASMRPNGRR